MTQSFFQSFILLLLVTDPFGNVPLFVATLRQVAPERRARVVDENAQHARRHVEACRQRRAVEVDAMTARAREPVAVVVLRLDLGASPG